MSENQHSAAEEQEQLPIDAEETAAAETETEQAAPAQETRLFGMSPACFRGTALGIALGFIICGMAGILFGIQLDDTICVLVCAGLGYGIARVIQSKREKKQQ